VRAERAVAHGKLGLCRGHQAGDPTGPAALVDQIVALRQSQSKFARTLETAEPSLAPVRVLQLPDELDGVRERESDGLAIPDAAAGVGAYS
jgi:hypothetical protein